MSNADIVRKIADGFTLPQIANEQNINLRGLEERVKQIRKVSNSKTLAALVANYFRKHIIE